MTGCPDPSSSVPFLDGDPDGGLDSRRLHLVEVYPEEGSCMGLREQIILTFEGPRVETDDLTTQMVGGDFWLSESHLPMPVRDLFKFEWGPELRITNVEKWISPFLKTIIDVQPLGDGLFRTTMQLTYGGALGIFDWDPSRDYTLTIEPFFRDNGTLYAFTPREIEFQTCRPRLEQRTFVGFDEDFIHRYVYDDENEYLTEIEILGYDEEINGRVEVEYIEEERDSLVIFTYYAQQRHVRSKGFRYNPDSRTLRYFEYEGEDHLSFIGEDGRWISGDETFPRVDETSHKVHQIQFLPTGDIQEYVSIYESTPGGRTPFQSWEADREDARDIRLFQYFRWDYEDEQSISGSPLLNLKNITDRIIYPVRTNFSRQIQQWSSTPISAFVENLIDDHNRWDFTYNDRGFLTQIDGLYDYTTVDGEQVIELRRQQRMEYEQGNLRFQLVEGLDLLDLFRDTPNRFISKEDIFFPIPPRP